VKEDPNFRLSYKIGRKQRTIQYGWWHTTRDGSGLFQSAFYPKKGQEEIFCPGDTAGGDKRTCCNIIYNLNQII